MFRCSKAMESNYQDLNPIRRRIHKNDELHPDIWDDFLTIDLKHMNVWIKASIVRQDIKAFAVNKSKRKDSEGNESDATYLNFYITTLKEPDANGNEFTLYIQEYDPEKKENVGDKVYIGKGKNLLKSEGNIAPSEPGKEDDLPF